MFSIVNDVKRRRCAVCEFASVERPNPNVLQDVLFCRWGPPVPVVLPAGPGKVAVQMIRPAVNVDDWCHRFSAREPLPEAADGA